MKLPAPANAPGHPRHEREALRLAIPLLMRRRVAYWNEKAPKDA